MTQEPNHLECSGEQASGLPGKKKKVIFLSRSSFFIPLEAFSLGHCTLGPNEFPRII